MFKKHQIQIFLRIAIYLYKENPKVGDEIYIDNEKVKITIVSKPYISKTSVSHIIDYIDAVLKEGGKRADFIASKKVLEMKKLIGF